MIRLAVEMAMDHKPSHREMTSMLISDMYAHVVSESDIAKGTNIYIKYSHVTSANIDLCF